MFNNSGKNCMIGHLTMKVNNEPFLTLADEGDIRIQDMRFEAVLVPQLYPQEKDFLWMFAAPDEYQLSELNAKFTAISDFWGYFDWLLRTQKNSLTIPEPKETFSWLLRLLEQLQDQFHNLIIRQHLDEQMLQSFIENHYFLISPHENPVLEKRKIDKFRTDFTLQYKEGMTLVELQLNKDPILSNGKPSSGLQDALTQMKDWFQFIQNNQPDKLKTTNGLIIIGRKESFDKNKDEIMKLVDALGYPISLITYDDLEQQVIELISLVRNKVAEFESKQ